MEITVTLPESVVESIREAPEDLTRLVELGARARRAEAAAGYASLSDVMEQLALLPSPDDVLRFRPSPELQQRIDELLEKNRSVGLDASERREWDAIEYVEHVVRLAKASALGRRRGAPAP